MRIPLSLAVIGYMLAEIACFIFVGEAIGVLPTLGLVLLGMVAGTVLLRRQGVSTLRKVQADLAARKVPARPLAEGAAQALGAVLIIIPGFVTDLIGIALFVPPVREALWRVFRPRIQFQAVGRDAPPPPRPVVVDLDRSEYAAGPEGHGTANTPWRLPDDARP